MVISSDLENRIYEYLYRAVARQESRPGIHVTDLVYDCLRRGYYRIKYGHGFYDLKTLLRFFIGRAVHSFPILGKHEVPVELDGVHGSVDDFDPERGILLEKKHTAYTKLPITPYPWHVRQIEFYKIMLENAGYKVNECYAVYIDVVTPRVKVIPVIPRDSEVIYDDFTTRRELLEYHLQEGYPPPRVITSMCELCTFSVPCFNPTFEEVLKNIKIDLGKRVSKARTITIKEILYKDQEITAVAKSQEDPDKEYAVYISPQEFMCSCMDQKMRRTVCKHILAVLMEAVAKGYLTYEEVGEYLKNWKRAMEHDEI